MALNPGMLDSPEWFEGLKTPPQRGGLLDRPGMRPLLAQVGLGLLMGGMAQPYGRSRGQAMGPYFQAGVQGMFPSEDTRLRRRYFKGQIGELESKAEKRKSQTRSRRELLQWYRTQESLRRFGTVQRPGAAPALPPAPQPQPWPPGPGGPRAGLSAPMSAPPSPMPLLPAPSGSPGQIPPGLLLGAFGDEALPYLMRSPKGFTLSPNQRRYGPRGGLIASAPGIPKAPTSRSRIAGGQTINEEFDPATNSWRQIGQGPRWDPRKGGPTLPQQANNAEIDAARHQFNALGLTREEILRRSQKATETGRDNPDYDPYIGRLVATATQRKVGLDADFESFYRRLYGAGPSRLSPEVLARPGVLPPPVGTPRSAAPRAALPVPRYPGMPRTTPAPTRQRRSATKPRVGERVTIQGKAYEVLKRNPDGTVMVMDLATGQQFIAE